MAQTNLPRTTSLAVFTVVSNNYLHFARSLLQSVSRNFPDADVYCVVVDRDLTPARKFQNEFSVIDLDALNIPNMAQMAFQYSILEFNTAVKPWAFMALLNSGYENVIYLDPDIFVYRSFDEVINALRQGADVVITPHLLKPIMDDKRPTELDIRRAGSYNLGFCAVRSSENTIAFLHWWQEKLSLDCVVDFDRGIFVDQSWIDLVPGLFENVNILRSPAYNVAYWNIAQRSIQQQPDGSWTVDGERLAFFHFSGFNPLSPEAFSKHQSRFTLANLGPAAALARAYASALVANGAKGFSRLAYGYGSFADGTAVSDGFRRLYLRNDDLRSLMGEDPFGQSGVLVEHAKDKDIASIPPITWAMLALYRLRPDLQSAFDLRGPEGAARFWDWFSSYGSADVPEWVMRRHRQLRSERGKTISSSDRLCHALYTNLLDRSPTATELDRLRRMCRTRIGASIALIQVARTPESRHRPRPTRRFKKAMRSIWHRSLADQRLGRSPAEASVDRGTRQGQFRLTGLYPSDSEAIELGVWAHVDLSIPLGNSKHEKIEILGNYFPSSLERMNGRATLGLDLRLDGRPWMRVDLPGTGEIAISEPVPDRLSASTALQIKSDSFFVPSVVGDGADHRELSWRLRKVVSNDTAVFDSGRQPSLLPLTQLFRPQGFNIVGYVFAELGVGEAARTMARAARSAAIPYSLCDVGYQTENRQSDMRAAEHAVDRFFPVDMLYVNADQTQNTLQYLDRTGRPRADYRIGFWHWEQPRLPEAYWSGFEGLNEVWVPTAFVHAAISAVSPVPVFKVPHAVDFVVDPRWIRASFGIPTNRFVVLVMYDFDSYRFRKNPEAAIAAFKLAARGRTDMTLVIKTINSSKYGDDYAALKADVAELDSVVFLDEVFSRDQIYGLEANCDCMLSLHRAEGFGFGPAEMMYLGKPVIATGWSGNMEFMTHDNSFPVNYELKPLAKPLGAYAAGLDWAEPDIEHAAACLRQVVEDRALAQDIGRRARQTMQTRFSPEAIGKQYLERLAWISMQL